MGVVTEDSMTEAALTLMVNHDADPTGTNWVEVHNDMSSGRALEIKAGSGECDPTGSEANDLVIIKSQPSPTEDEYDVKLEFNGVEAIDDDFCGAAGRMTAANNGYFLFVTGAAQTNDFRLIKIVSGTATDLVANVDIGIAIGEDITFQIRDAAKKGFHGASESLSNTDNALTASGDGGIFMGDIRQDNGSNVDGSWEITHYTLTEVAVGGFAHAQVHAIG